MGWVLNTCPGRYTSGKDTRFPGSIWMGTESPDHTRVRTPDLQACSESLYRLCYCNFRHRFNLITCLKSISTVQKHKQLGFTIDLFIMIRVINLCCFAATTDVKRKDGGLRLSLFSESSVIAYCEV
jgi:hypothetical protein